MLSELDLAAQHAVIMLAFINYMVIKPQYFPNDKVPQGTKNENATFSYRHINDHSQLASAKVTVYKVFLTYTPAVSAGDSRRCLCSCR